MKNIFNLTNTSTYLVVIIFFVVLLLLLENYYKWQRKNDKCFFPEPPSPMKLPILGHLHLLGGYELPFQAFSELGKKYGDVIKLKLGSVNIVVVNSPETVREVLITKGPHFDNRPTFERYRQLFGGNLDYSLDFCSWSEAHRNRRQMLRLFTFPRMYTNKYVEIETNISEETAQLISTIKQGGCIEIKPLLLIACGNIFLRHFASTRCDENNREYLEFLDIFDEVFYEVNQGYAADFLPFLLPLHYRRMARMNSFQDKIRSFFETYVIRNRYAQMTADYEPVDYAETILHHFKFDGFAVQNWDAAFYALEDTIGGHCAMGNLIVKLLGFLVKEPKVQQKIQKEIDLATDGGTKTVTVGNKLSMPYTDAAILEGIRLICSPIIPRVSNRETTIKGYRVEKDVMVLLNNYELCMSEKLWDEPELFKPERFLVDGRVTNPHHFLPFGGGKRSCLGYKIVFLVCFGVLSPILQNFTIWPVESEVYKVPVGTIALPKKSFKFNFVPRENGVIKN